MLRRTLSTALVAGLVTVATPGVSHASVSSLATDSFPDFDATVRTITHKGSTIYVGGDFDHVTDAQGTTFTRHGAAAVDATSGAVLPWNPRVRGSVYKLKVSKEGVYIGGSFGKVKKKTRHNLALVAKGGKARLVKAFRPSTNARVSAIATSKRRVYVGGDFTQVNGRDRSRLAAFPRRASTLTGWTPKATNGQVFDLVRKKAGVYVAGEFRMFNGSGADQRLALVTKKRGRTRGAFDPSVTQLLFDIAVRGGTVYAAQGGSNGGGAFAVNATNGNRLWSRRFDGDVQAVTATSAEIYFGGHFTRVCTGDAQSPSGTCQNGNPSPRGRGASLDPATGALNAWNPRANSNLGVEALDKVGTSRLYMGGAFTALDGGSTPARGFAVFE